MASGQLLGIFYAEFDDERGPRIAFQEPEGFLSPADFSLLAAYLVSDDHGGGGGGTDGGDFDDG